MAQSKDTIPRRRMNTQLVQNILLLWLDTIIDDTNVDHHIIVSQLRQIVNMIKTFTNRDECVDFLTDIQNENVCLIISDTLCEDVIPHIHDVVHLRNIFIFCADERKHKHWVKQWPKIKDVCTEIAPICNALKKLAQYYEQNAIAFSLVQTNDNLSKKNLNRLDPIFMYSTILKEILLDIKFERKHFKDFIDYCREVYSENAGHLKNITEFDEKYANKTPIWWYTWDSFLYPMLNRALRITDLEGIIKIGFYIGDLHRQLEKLHNQQIADKKLDQIFTVYRGQNMSKQEFEKMRGTLDGLISFNNFLSTTKQENIALLFADLHPSEQDKVGVLFVMTIDCLKSTTPFAAIQDFGIFGNAEEEILFSMHTVFRIRQIQPMDENSRLFRVELALTDDNDKDLCDLTNRIRQETFPNAEGWHRLGLMLSKMGHSEKAQQVYEILLEQETTEDEKALIYRFLGLMKYNQGAYEEAINFYEKAIEIYKKTRFPNDINLGMFYNDIGLVYAEMGEYTKALSYYEKSLKTKQQSLTANDPHLASSYNNIGLVYYNMGKYPKALLYYEKSLEIQQQLLPPNHPHLASSYNNIGLAYDKMCENAKALSYYKRSLEIKQQSLPSNHPHLASSYNNIGNVYFKLGEYAKTLSYYEKSLEIQQQFLPPNHPNLGSSYNNIGMMYDSRGEYAKALSYYEKSLEISQKSRPPNHPDLSETYDNMGSTYENMGNYSKARSSYEKAVSIAEKSLQKNHPDLQKWKRDLERIRNKI